MKRRNVTMTVTVSVPGWLRKSDAIREVRTLINDGTVWGTLRPDTFDSIDLGDIRARKIR